jgi:hypothetical protein
MDEDDEGKGYRNEKAREKRKTETVVGVITSEKGTLFQVFIKKGSHRELVLDGAPPSLLVRRLRTRRNTNVFRTMVSAPWGCLVNARLHPMTFRLLPTLTSRSDTT